jgi:hypothetical protein
MFVVDAAVLLQHPPHAVARVVERLHLLPRWCIGLRRVRFPPPALAPAEPAARTCVFTYAIADVRLTLQARTLANPPGAVPVAVDAAPVAVTHIAAGDGLTLVWTLTAEPSDGPGVPHAAPPAHTRLSACVEVHVEATHPLAATRAPLCRAVARRVPTDLERLRALLDRYEAVRAPVPLPTSPLRTGSPGTAP